MNTKQKIDKLEETISGDRSNTYENNVVKIFNDFMDSTYSLQDFKKLNPFLKEAHPLHNFYSVHLYFRRFRNIKPQ